MKTCDDNGWKYLVVLKDDSLKNLQIDIADTHPKDYRFTELENISNKGHRKTHQQISWITDAFMHKDCTCYWLLKPQIQNIPIFKTKRTYSTRSNIPTCQSQKL